MSYSYAFKVIVIGDVAVGKTSLINRYFKEEFNPEYFPTIGANVHENRINFDGFTIKFTVWDVSGDKRFGDVVMEYYANAHAAVLVFEVSRKDSFSDIGQWYREAVRLMQEEPLIYVAGNKVDLGAVRLVSEEEAKKKAESLNAAYFELSAKSGQNVDALFTSILKGLLRKRLKEIRMRLKEITAQVK